MRFNIATKSIFLIAALIVLYISRIIVLATLIGIGIAVLIAPLLDLLQKKLRLKRGIGAVFLIITGLSIFTYVATMIGWVVLDQTNALVKSVPKLTENLQVGLGSAFAQYPWFLEQIESIDFGGSIQKIVEYSFFSAQLGAFAIGGVVFAFIIGIYLAVDAQFYFDGTVRAFRPKHRSRARDLLIKCSHVVRTWFGAQLIDMLIIGLITTLGLWSVGVKYWALFGLLTAVFGIIPYVGVLIVVVIVSLITVTSDPSLVPWVWLVFFVTQQIEGNVVLPLVMKGQVEIPEAVLIVVMLLFGTWFGLLGLFIAPPIVAVGLCLYRQLYLPLIEARGEEYP